jgi:N-succinyldiaminopimelate aminotransferase
MLSSTAMPKQRPSTHTNSIRGAVYSSLVSRMATLEGEIYPFHVGDTWMEPALSCRMEDLTVARYPGMHRYSHPHGLAGLLDMLVEETRARTGVAVERTDIQVTAGATAALGLAVGAVCDPGDEVLILAPYWPLIEGIVRAFRATPVVVPIEDCSTAAEVIARLDQACGERTVALYHSFPNNPTGRTVPADFIEGLTGWASRNQLWIFSDEVYEKYAYRGEATNALALAPERTFTVHSFSKSYGMAGNRCGYVVGPRELMPEVEKLATHTFYCAPTSAQLAAMRVLGHDSQGETDALSPGDAWVRNARQLYQQVGNQVAESLGVAPPDGGTFLFLDLRATLEARSNGDLLGFLEQCAERGLFLAPGDSFGPYPNHARLCFTAVAPEVTLRGARVLADMMVPCS